jgi:hypothetical protein
MQGSWKIYCAMEGVETFYTHPTFAKDVCHISSSELNDLAFSK